MLKKECKIYSDDIFYYEVSHYRFYYVIEKKNVGSTLASECEGLNETDTTEKGNNYGQSVV